jgi:DNA-directed RNA polymerase subunit K/omega
MEASKMYNLRIENLIKENTSVYILVVAAAQLARATAGAAEEEGLKPTTKALTDLVDETANYEYKQE